MRYILKIQLHLIRQSVSVFGIPACRMARIHHPLGTAGTLAAVLILGGDNKGLEICKQLDIAPFPDKRRYVLAHLQLVPVKAARFIRKLEFLDLCMTADHHIHACRDHLIQLVQQILELFPQVHIALAVSEGFQPVRLVFLADVPHTKSLRPVTGIQHQCLAYARISRHIPDDL